NLLNIYLVLARITFRIEQLVFVVTFYISFVISIMHMLLKCLNIESTVTGSNNIPSIPVNLDSDAEHSVEDINSPEKNAPPIQKPKKLRNKTLLALKIFYFAQRGCKLAVTQGGTFLADGLTDDDKVTKIFMTLNHLQMIWPIVPRAVCSL
ncbi:hypothetical protein ACJX0J_014214, partial [Zea mays]